MNLNKLSLGRYIRQLRREKGILLKDLAADICSIGKMSNIENGIGNVSEEELEKICEKLNINYSDFISNFQTDAIHSKPLDELENQLFFGLYPIVKEQLDMIEKQLEEDHHEIDKFQYLYISGLYNYLMEDIDKSLDILHSIPNEKPKYSNNVRDIHRTYNLLSKIYFEMGNEVETLELINKALQINDPKEVWKSTFNAALFYAYKGKPIECRLYLNRLKKMKECTNLCGNKILYLQFYLELFEGENKTTSDFNELLEILKEHKDYELTYSLYFLKWSIQPREWSFLENFIKDAIDCSGYKRHANKKIDKMLIYITQYMIEQVLREKNYKDCERYLKMAISLSEKFPDLELNYYTYFLNAQFIKHTDPENYDEQMKLYNKALKCLSNTNIFSTKKGVIHYELSRLTEPQSDNRHQRLALESFYFSYLNELKISNISYWLPDFVY
ncbi:helix-turn-helix domain-containing protein [Peribacillus asahii]|uniref:helix-turn-helix domain-containing protein n=1 Tax=Peribacillus asahii TaxID=228899 RepID=UPI002079337B|nr:helix-turn-helix transcriptional regulator [Peribacillus asahii]USK62343.1 helix-turn-helix domain-containing protein [Peribacillus asahii]